MTVHQSLAEWSSWIWPFLANHLWQSTLLSMAAFAAAAILKNAPGRARYAIWLIASAKFIVPSALLVFIAREFGFGLPSLFATVPESQGYTVIYQLTSPLTQLDDSAVGGAAAARGHNELFCVLTITWFTGCVFLLGLWWRSRQRFRSAIKPKSVANVTRERLALDRVRSWLGIKRHIDLSVVPGSIEPGVWGVIKPIVLLPESIAEDLSEAELEAVMMHEMIHVARWDNLIANLHRILCCLLWFNPIVWILDRLLLAEREQACDEEVIRLGGASDVYASSLLKVLRFCLGWSVTGASNASGSNLGRRVERIMSGNVRVRFTLWHRAAVGSIAAMAITLSLAVGFLARKGVVAQTIKSQTAMIPGGMAGTLPIAGAEVRMPADEDSVGVGTIVKCLKHVGDSVMLGEPLFEISTNKASAIIPSTATGVVAQINVKEGQTVPVNAVVAVIQPRAPEVEEDNAGRNMGYAFTIGQDRLIERLEAAPLTAVEFKNSAKSPLAITDARVKAVPRLLNEPGDEYAVVPVVSMVNNSDRRIKGFTLEFRNGVERRAYYEFVPALVDRQAVYASGGQMRFITLVGGADGWTVRVAGVLFEYGDVWGVVPPPPPPPPPPTELKPLDQLPEIAIGFKNLDGAPLSITNATLNAQPDSNPNSDERYVIKLGVQLANNTARRITHVAIDYTNPESKDRIQTYSSVKIDAYGSYKLGGPEQRGYGVSSVPDRMEARVMGAKFEDGEVWGSFPSHSPPLLPPPPPQRERTPDSPKLIRKSGGVMINSVTHRVEPEYPPLARAARITGSVEVEVTVDEAGAVISATAISGHPLLRDAAVTAARQWQFAPTMLSRVPTKVVGNLTFNFAP